MKASSIDERQLMTDRPPTFVLVAGAWAGGWAWRRVERILRTAGHDVFTPTLTGLAERAHLAGPQVDLDTHIQDVVGLLQVEELEQVVLVGWSYSGTVITGVLEVVPERLVHVVYLDAEVPRDGEAEFDLLGPETREAMEENARTSGDGWSASVGDAEACAGFLGQTLRDADTTRWVAEKLAAGGQPIETFRQPVRIRNPAADRVPRTFLRCPVAGEAWADLYGSIVERVRDDHRWRVRELPSSHLAPLRDPQLVAETLLDISRDPRNVVTHSS